MKKFELFMGYLGNGITVCNKAVMEHGDYKYIAHIRETGKIKWYVKDGYVPGDVLLKIEHIANVQAEKWEKWFSTMTETKQYEYLMNRIPLKDFLEIIDRKDLDMWQKIQIAKLAYYKAS